MVFICQFDNIYFTVANLILYLFLRNNKSLYLHLLKTKNYI